jgi:hypothetical protein
MFPLFYLRLWRGKPTVWHDFSTATIMNSDSYPHIQVGSVTASGDAKIYIGDVYSENRASEPLLSTLPVASEAAFNSLHNQHEPTCLLNTRAELLQDIATWVDGADERCVVWLKGMAGTGKSTVARIIARTYYNRGVLGASFFFSRGGGDLSNANKFVTTLARQLATRLPVAKGHINEAIKEQETL